MVIVSQTLGCPGEKSFSLIRDNFINRYELTASLEHFNNLLQNCTQKLPFMGL